MSYDFWILMLVVWSYGQPCINFSKKKGKQQYNGMQVYTRGAFRISSKLTHTHFFAIGKWEIVGHSVHSSVTHSFQDSGISVPFFLFGTKKTFLSLCMSSAGKFLCCHLNKEEYWQQTWSPKRGPSSRSLLWKQTQRNILNHFNALTQHFWEK